MDDTNYDGGLDLNGNPYGAASLQVPQSPGFFGNLGAAFGRSAQAGGGLRSLLSAASPQFFSGLQNQLGSGSGLNYLNPPGQANAANKPTRGQSAPFISGGFGDPNSAAALTMQQDKGKGGGSGGILSSLGGF